MYGIFTYIWVISRANVSIYIPYMDPMGNAEICLMYKPVLGFAGFVLTWTSQVRPGQGIFPHCDGPVYYPKAWPARLGVEPVYEGTRGGLGPMVFIGFYGRYITDW